MKWPWESRYEVGPLKCPACGSERHVVLGTWEQVWLVDGKPEGRAKGLRAMCYDCAKPLEVDGGGVRVMKLAAAAEGVGRQGPEDEWAALPDTDVAVPTSEREKYKRGRG